jgi:hypothetical protein
LSHSSGETDLLVCAMDHGTNTNTHANSAAQSANNFHDCSPVVGFRGFGIECFNVGCSSRDTKIHSPDIDYLYSNILYVKEFLVDFSFRNDRPHRWSI